MAFWMPGVLLWVLQRVYIYADCFEQVVMQLWQLPVAVCEVLGERSNLTKKVEIRDCGRDRVIYHQKLLP